ncbi:hypothetical protein COCOBI_11-0460 [Coccomyxa sp. Obi]|nr:hypothetical protein COCOBI_11-0460 [Coccomyxa sp. Obi]
MEPIRYEHSSEISDSDDSSYASSCEDAESSEDDQNSPCSSPRSADHDNSLPPVPQAGQMSPKRPLKPKVPILGLRLDGGTVSRGPGTATPRTMAQPENARGRPSIAVPRLPTARGSEDSAAAREPPAGIAAAAAVPRWPQHSSGRASSLPTPQAVGIDRCGGQATCAPSSSISLSLLSSAMVLEQKSTVKGSQLAHAALGKFSAALGVRQSELTLYEVREVKEGMQLAPGTTRLAVAVKNSGFSLGAVEKLLEENKRLKAAADAGSRELDSARRLCREQQAEALSRAHSTAEQAAAKEVEVQELKEVLHVLEEEVTSLREQLKRSHSLRLQGQKALDELKSEFEALTKDLAGDAAASLSATSAMTHGATASPVKPDSGPLQQQDRIASVLEKLCDETVLSRLECCFAQAGL